MNSKTRSSFFHAAVSTSPSVLSHEIDKYLFLQYVASKAPSFPFRIHAFVLLNDSFDLLIGSDKASCKEPALIIEKLMSDYTSFYSMGPESGRHLVREQIGLRPDFSSPEKMSPLFFHEDAGDKRGKCLVTSVMIPLNDEKQALACCAHIHSLPLVYGFVSNINYYWWSSYQTYRGSYRWPFLETDLIYSLLDEQGTDPLAAFLRFHRSYMKGIKNDH